MIFSKLLMLVGFAAASNVDNVGVAVAYGFRGARIPFSCNLLIAVVTTGATLGAFLFGRAVGEFLSPGTANLAAGVLLMILGAGALFVPSCRRLAAAGGAGGVAAAIVGSRDGISLREGLALSVTLSFNNLANGAVAGLAGLDLGVLMVLVFLFSLATIALGSDAGALVGARWLGRHGGRVSGLLLIALGAMAIFL
jgi:putative Mn2+ efflux pump MntP